MSRNRQRKGGRTTPPGTRPPSSKRPSDSTPPIVRDATRALRQPSPFDLLSFASSVIEATTPRPTDALADPPIERPDGHEVLGGLLAAGFAPLQALALGVATLHPDDEFAGQLRTMIDLTGLERPPRWLASMSVIDVDEANIQTELLGDGENLTLSFRWPDGSGATAVVYVDHNIGTMVKDAFFMPVDAAEYRRMVDNLGDDDLTLAPISLADAAARIREAIATCDRTVPSIETDSWPTCRPLLEWVLRRLPDDGTGYVRVEVPAADRQQLVEDFAASPFGTIDDLSIDEVRTLAEPLVRFACDDGPGDPLRWSPVSVEIVLDDWYSHELLHNELQVGRAERLPEVLTAFVRFAHDRRQVPERLTDETVQNIDRFAGAYLAAIAD